MPTLDWIGKRAVINHHRDVPYRLIHCDKSKSFGDPDAGNLLVQGDNLEALKALLPYYAGKVKCIYIDPPYNTGNEGWIYNDNVNSPEIRAWLGKVVGKEAEDLSRHDKWLCMMYPRLRLLREFLREDGVIFVSVDENEYHHLALLMDEIFDRRNRVETLIWKKTYGGGSKSKHVVNVHEYIEFFCMNKSKLPPIFLPPSEGALKYYKYEDEKLPLRGPYRLQPLATNSMDERPNLRYPIDHEGVEIWPEKQWQWSREKVEKAQQNNEIVIALKKGKYSVNYKQYLKSDEGEERSSKLYSIIDGIYTQTGTAEIREILGDGKAFNFPKPSNLVRDLVLATTDRDSIVLDSFAGSGTTAQAVSKANLLDGGDRKFVLVEMDYSVSNNVTFNRMRKAPEVATGFRYCTLGEPLFDAYGNVSPSVTYPDLAAHVFFCETGSPIPRRADGSTPLIGTFQGRAIYLLHAADSVGVPNAAAGNVLTAAVLETLPVPEEGFTGARVVYAEGCSLPDDRLNALGITFKQVPYQIEGL